MGVQINNCRVFITGTHGIHVNRTLNLLNISNCQIYWNNISGNGGNGVNIAKRTEYFTIADNQIGFNPKGGTYDAQPVHGIFVKANCANYNKTDNEVEATTADYFFETNTDLTITRAVKGNFGRPSYAGYQTASPFQLPQTGSAWVNYTAFDVDVYLYGGTVTLVEKMFPDGTKRPMAASTPALVRVRPGESFIVAYTGVPTVTFDVAK
jgi:hypothetical protein